MKNVAQMENDMERWIADRERVGKQLDSARKRKEDAEKNSSYQVVFIFMSKGCFVSFLRFSIQEFLGYYWTGCCQIGRYQRCLQNLVRRLIVILTFTKTSILDVLPDSEYLSGSLPNVRKTCLKSAVKTPD